MRSGGPSRAFGQFAVDDILPLARAAAEASVPLRVVGALDWRTHDLVEIAKVGKGHVIFE